MTNIYYEKILSFSSEMPQQYAILPLDVIAFWSLMFSNFHRSLLLDDVRRANMYLLNLSLNHRKNPPPNYLPLHNTCKMDRLHIKL